MSYENEYDGTLKTLENAIHRWTVLREAQVPGSRNQGLFQARIDALTNVLLAFERGIPQLQELDREIAVADRDVAAAMRQSQDGAALLPRAAGVTGLAGGLGLLTSLGLNLHWALATGSISLLLISAGCVALSSRRRRLDLEGIGEARGDLADLLGERQELLPPSIDEVVNSITADSTPAVHTTAVS